MVPAECLSKSLQMKIFDSIQVGLKSIILLLFSFIVESSVTIIKQIFWQMGLNLYFKSMSHLVPNILLGLNVLFKEKGRLNKS